MWCVYSPGCAPMFLGEYEYNIDQKGRVAIPARFREEFRGGLVIARGYDRCLVAYPLAEWQRMADRVTSLPLTRSSSRRLTRATFANAYNLEMLQRAVHCKQVLGMARLPRPVVLDTLRPPLTSPSACTNPRRLWPTATNPVPVTPYFRNWRREIGGIRILCLLYFRRGADFALR